MWWSRLANPADDGGARSVCAGYSFVELLVAMVIMLAVVAATLTMTSELHVGFGAASERVDGQQRLRAAVDALSRDLFRAGTGAYQDRKSTRLNSSH